jgi:hypothetical protein
LRPTEPVEVLSLDLSFNGVVAVFTSESFFSRFSRCSFLSGVISLRFDETLLDELSKLRVTCVFFPADGRAGDFVGIPVFFDFFVFLLPFFLREFSFTLLSSSCTHFEFSA